MPLFQNHIGIAVSTSKLQIVEIIYTGEKFVLENLNEAYFDEVLDINSKQTKILSLLQNAYNEIIVRKPLKSTNVSFALPHSFFKLAKLPYENSLSQSELLQHFLWEFSILYPEIKTDELLLQFIPFDQNEENNYSLVIASYKNYLKILLRFCERNGLKLKYIDNAHLSINKLLPFTNSEINNVKIVSVFVSESDISISEIYNNEITGFKHINYSNPNEVIKTIQNEINDKFQKKIFLNGTIDLKVFRSELENQNLQFIDVDPFEKIQIADEIKNEKLFTEKSKIFLTAASIAFRRV